MVRNSWAAFRAYNIKLYGLKDKKQTLRSYPDLKDQLYHYCSPADGPPRPLLAPWWPFVARRPLKGRAGCAATESWLARERPPSRPKRRTHALVFVTLPSNIKLEFKTTTFKPFQLQPDKSNIEINSKMKTTSNSNDKHKSETTVKQSKGH